ncbi:hypothetical protein [Enterococcus sp. AZ109]|uniref:hypothetical protein n=1 Tax=Enterococcus sp. AZ109 TaxID=2774634 RepID=UPI003F257108
MKKHNEKIVELSQELSKGNVQKSLETATRVTRPSKATQAASLLGTTLGVGLLCGGLIGTVLGKNVIGLSSLAVGALTIVSNMKNFKRK